MKEVIPLAFSDRPSPLVHALTASGVFDAPIEPYGDSTRSSVADNIDGALRALALGHLHTADAKLKEAFERQEHSQSVRPVDHADRGLERRIISFGDDVRQRLVSHGIPSDFIVKQGSPALIARTVFLSKLLYYEGLDRHDFPRVEELAYTMRKGRPSLMIAPFYGPNLEQTLHTSRVPEKEILTRVLSHTAQLLHYLRRDSDCGYMVPAAAVKDLLAQATPEEYERKHAESLASFSRFFRRIDARRCASRILADEGCFVPFTDPKSANFVLHDGILRHIDLERTVQTLVHPAHLYAHIWFDPAYHLSFEERLVNLQEHAGKLGARKENVTHALFFYLLRQVAVASRGVRILNEEHAACVRDRVRGHAENLRTLSHYLEGYHAASALSRLDVSAYVASVPMLRGGGQASAR